RSAVLGAEGAPRSLLRRGREQRPHRRARRQALLRLPGHRGRGPVVTVLDPRASRAAGDLMIGTSLPRTFGRSALLLTGLLACVAQAAAGQALPPSALSVRVGDDWERICTCEAAPTRWGGVV